MHIDGITYVNVPKRQHGYIHYKCGRWHIVKVIHGKRYSLGSYDMLKEAELVLQKANEMISEDRFEEWYNDYKIKLKENHNSNLIEAKRKTIKK
jgi:hypothetical protein